MVAVNLSVFITTGSFGFREDAVSFIVAVSFSVLISTDWLDERADPVCFIVAVNFSVLITIGLKSPVVVVPGFVAVDPDDVPEVPEAGIEHCRRREVMSAWML